MNHFKSQLAFRHLSGAPTKDRKLEKLSAILSTTTIRAKSESFEQIHVCVPNDECGDKEVVGINIVYTCSCHEGLFFLRFLKIYRGFN